MLIIKAQSANLCDFWHFLICSDKSVKSIPEVA
nr:MAG TPA: hypothetical protein [Caudoviricetes sp.]